MSNIWDALYRYFLSLRSRLNFVTSTVNEPYNVIVVKAPLHAAFGSFHSTFELSVKPKIGSIELIPNSVRVLTIL